jgi:hypothetical protein
MEYKTIGIYVHEEVGPKKRAKVDILYCKLEECPLLAQKKCLANCFFGRCVYGYIREDIGPTKRANKYYSYCKEWENKSKELPNPQPSYGKIFEEIGDYIYLPYAHMTMCKDAPFIAHSAIFISGVPFILKNLFDAKMVVTLANFRPFASVGDEIKIYQETIVPVFLFHLKYKKPKLFKEACKIDPSLEKRVNLSIKVPLQTNIGVIPPYESEGWKLSEKDFTVSSWDGKTLSLITPKTSFLFLYGQNYQIQYEPDLERTQVIITDMELACRCAVEHPEMIKES